MKTKLLIGLVVLLCVDVVAQLRPLTVATNTAKAYEPGAYGKVKDAPMFICWREWDGEIRIGGMIKSLSGHCGLGDIGEYFAVEIQGASGCANFEQLMFGPGTSNIVIGTNYTGTIQIGTNFYTQKDFADLAVIPRSNFPIWRANAVMSPPFQLQPKTVKWQHIEIGYRNDGVVVWREVPEGEAK